jgi:sarcosine oxidase subunit beta
MELMQFYLNREQVKEIIPMADFSENVRFPIFGGLMQPSAGTARHDAVAWGYARQADSMGVDIIQNCEVTGFDVSGGKINGVRTSRGDIKVKKIGLVCCRKHKHFSRKIKYDFAS